MQIPIKILSRVINSIPVTMKCKVRSYCHNIRSQYRVWSPYNEFRYEENGSEILCFSYISMCPFNLMINSFRIIFLGHKYTWYCIYPINSGLLGIPYDDKNLFCIGLGNSLYPDSTKPIFICHQWSPVTFTLYSIMSILQTKCYLKLISKKWTNIQEGSS